MSSRHHRLPIGRARLVRGLTLVLLPAFLLRANLLAAPHRTMSKGPPASLPGEMPASFPRPYLAAVGTPPLRFEELLPPPDLTTDLPAAAPPVPGGPLEAVAAANRDSAITHAGIPPGTTPPDHEEPEPVAPRGPATPTPARILPDDTRREVAPEEVLPFFQYPGNAAQPDVTIAVPFTPPAPRGPALPPSSARYRQQ